MNTWQRAGDKLSLWMEKLVWPMGANPGEFPTPQNPGELGIRYPQSDEWDWGIVPFPYGPFPRMPEKSMGPPTIDMYKDEYKILDGQMSRAAQGITPSRFPTMPQTASPTPSYGAVPPPQVPSPPPQIPTAQPMGLPEVGTYPGFNPSIEIKDPSGMMYIPLMDETREKLDIVLNRAMNTGKEMADQVMNTVVYPTTGVGFEQFSYFLQNLAARYGQEPFRYEELRKLHRNQLAQCIMDGECDPQAYDRIFAEYPNLRATIENEVRNSMPNSQIDQLESLWRRPEYPEQGSF